MLYEHSTLSMRALEIPKELIQKDFGDVREVKMLTGEVACDADSECKSLLVVEKGSLKVYRRSADGRTFTLYRISAGECCCLTVACILNGTKFPAVAEAENDVVAYVISAQHLRKWLREDQEWQSYIFTQLTQKITQFTSLTDNLVFHSMNSRIANLLCNSSGDRLFINTTHQCLANEVGTSREVVSRSLGLLETAGYIKLTRGQVEIVDFDALHSYSVLH